MAGVKRKLDHDPAPNAPDPDLHPSQASSPAAFATPERDSNAVTKAVRGARVRPKAAAVTATTATTAAAAAAAAATTTSTPSSAASSQPQSPAKKRRRTRDEILAEQFDELPGPRTTRQSARILSQRRATDPAPNVAFGAGSLPKAASMEPGVPGVASFDTSHESLSFDLGAGLLLGPTSAAPTAATTSAPTDLENSLQAVDNNDASGESSSAKPKRRRRLSDRKRARSAARDDLDSPGPGVETPTTSPIKTPKREHSDDSDAQDDTPSAAASRSVPALTLATDLPASQSTDVETPDGGGAGRPASALSMSPPATQSEAAELSASTIPAAGGRTRAAGGRPRGKGKARKPPLNRKAAAAAGKAAAPRMHAYDRNLSPSASAAVKKLRDRQRELQGAFRRVSSAQRAALLVLANRSESRLAKDPKAHMSTPLYQEVLDGLEARLEKQKALINREYDLKVQCEKQYLEAAQYWINSGFEEKVESVRDEHILAAQGSFLQYLDQCRQAGDDDHTETEESDTENWRTNRKVSHQSVRGFDGSYIRRPSGASLYDRADSGWDDFIQRARIGGDIFALLKDMDQEARRDKEEKKRLRQEAKKKNREAAAEESEVSDSDIVPEPVHSRQRFKRLISALADACQLAEAGGSDEKEEEEEEEEEEEIKATEEPNPPAYALNALADIALQSPTSIQSSVTSAPFAPPMEPVATTAAAAAVAPPPEPTPQPPPVAHTAPICRPTGAAWTSTPSPATAHPWPDPARASQPAEALPASPICTSRTATAARSSAHARILPQHAATTAPRQPSSASRPPAYPAEAQRGAQTAGPILLRATALTCSRRPALLHRRTTPSSAPPPPPHHAHPHVRRASQPAPYAAAPLPPPYLPGPPPPSSAQQPPPGYAHPVELPLPGTLYQPQSIYPPPYYSPYHHPHPAAAPSRPHQSVFGRDALQLGHPPRGALHPQMHPPPPPPRY
ncbi:hypothetical protein LOZ16_006009 [Ophidiomyces ophidiicola]|nr:hypothetical protein LOZ16_006009 [Ophidiomyces ophidiicola]KAI2251081.1 hypothetical protein LOZ09_005582 [Ophidiomyces ophidiicola]